jgi:hypothetical protein
MDEADEVWALMDALDVLENLLGMKELDGLKRA